MFWFYFHICFHFEQMVKKKIRVQSEHTHIHEASGDPDQEETSYEFTQTLRHQIINKRDGVNQH